MYFGLDDIEIDGVKGKKSESLEELPPLLHIQLQASLLALPKLCFSLTSGVFYSLASAIRPRNQKVRYFRVTGDRGADMSAGDYLVHSSRTRTSSLLKL